MLSASSERISDMTAQLNIVLVHGAWADGSSWSAVVQQLQSDGYNVTAPQFPESSLANDVARLHQVWTVRTARHWWPHIHMAARS
jgi:hypothetical protein